MKRAPDTVRRFRSDETRRLVRALAAFAVVLVAGVVGFMVTEDGWGVGQSLYFTIITLSTVGYGDEGLSDAGRHFAAGLIMLGIGTFTYTLGQVVQFAVSRQLAWRQKMQRHIDHLDDHFIICGLGRVGQAVCERFTEAAMPVVIIENDPKRVQWAHDHGQLVIEGSADDEEVLLQAGVERARGIVCATCSDAENLVTTLTARDLNPRALIISRVDDIRSEQRFKRAGATYVVSPAHNGGYDIATMLIRPNLADFWQRARSCDSGYQLTELTVNANSELEGQTLGQFGTLHAALVFVALRRDGETRIRPPVDEQLRAGDVIILAGESEALAQLTAQAGIATLSAAG